MMTYSWYRKQDRVMFLEHINSIDPCIQFKVEETRANGSVPFLDTLVIPEPDRSLTKTVYSKCTHTDKQLQWDNHDNLNAKYSYQYPGTQNQDHLFHPQLLEKEKHIKQALQGCKHPNQALNRAKIKSNKHTNPNQQFQQLQQQPNTKQKQEHIQ